MRIVNIISQHRRDFTANIECEGCCVKEVLHTGYDDRNYHDNVMPNMRCRNCGKSRNDLGIKESPTPTKYAEWETV